MNLNIVNVCLEDLSANIASWNSDYQFNLNGPWGNDRAVVWGAGNYLITLRKVTENQCEITWRPYKLSPPNDIADRSYDVLNSFFLEAGWINYIPPFYYRELPSDEQLETIIYRSSKETQNNKDLRVGMIEKARRDLQERRMLDDVTAEQAALVYLDGICAPKVGEIKTPKEALTSMAPVADTIQGGKDEEMFNKKEGAGKQKQYKSPTARTQIRFEVFQRLKKANPTWSQNKVAMEAVTELGESVTGETVRNTYRLMGAKWERGDRIR